MIPNNFKDSLVISEQLPSFIRNDKDYQTFISFIEAYYEFLETDKIVIDRTKNLLNYKDVDETLEEFHQYFFNEFLQYFPKESLTDKIDLVKFARELYQRKSTPASFKFLFRALYNSDCETVNTRDFVLIPSDGKWQISRFVRVNSIDPTFLNIKNYKLFGETSKAIAKIENSQVISNKTEIFLSDIIRSFSSGEYVKVVDDKLKDVIIDGKVLRAKIVGSVSSIVVDPSNRGLNYKPKDPVIVYGGLNDELESPIGAIAEVGSVSNGVVRSVNVLEGSNGYRYYPNTIIKIVGGGGSGLDVRVSSLDTQNVANVSIVSTDIILPYAPTLLNATNYNFPNFPQANINSKLIEAFTSVTFDTYPISAVAIQSPGSNYSGEPLLVPRTFFKSNNVTYDLTQYGILAPIKVNFGGYNYSKGDPVILTGGSGYGAFANVASVDANGSIQKIQYIQYPDKLFPLGGFGYSTDNLPNVHIESSNNKIIYLTTSDYGDIDTNILYFSNTSNLKIGMYVSGDGIDNQLTLNYFDSNVRISNISTNYVELTANLKQEVLPGTTYKFDGSSIISLNSILGDGAKFKLTYDTIGAIQTINLISSGEDYLSEPSVSVRIMDIAVSGVNESLLPSKGDFLYQGTSYRNFTFGGFVESIGRLENVYVIRLYNYTGILNKNILFYIDKQGESSKTLSFSLEKTYSRNGFVSGTKIFGDGNAKANAKFISGTVSLKGKYLNSDGFLSDSNYTQSEIYNFYSYFLTIEKAFVEYKDLVKNLLNPAGKQLIPIDAEKSSSNVKLINNIDLFKEIELRSVTNPYTRKLFVGGIKEIFLLNGSNGFRVTPNSIVTITSSDPFGYGVDVDITSVDTANVAPVSLLSVEIISPYKDVLLRSSSFGFPNFPSANANTKIVDALTTIGFDTYPIAGLTINDYGTGYETPPKFEATSNFTYGSDKYNIKDFGILSPIKIDYSGFNYSQGDVVLLDGGSGFGAYANVSSVDANGCITSVQYYQDQNNLYPLGGLGYTSNTLPTINILSTNNKISYLTSEYFANVGNTVLYTTSSTNNVKIGMFVSGLGVQSSTKIVDVGSNYIELSSPLQTEVYTGNTYIVDGSASLSIYSVLGDKAVITSDVEPSVLTDVPLNGVLIEENALKVYELRKDITGILLSTVLQANDYIHMVSSHGEEFITEIKSIDDINDIIYFKDSYMLYYSNVAYGYTDANSIIISNTTSSFDLVNGGKYSNSSNKLEDIVFINDRVYISNNNSKSINNVDYTNGKIYSRQLFNPSGNITNPELISVKRNFVTNNIHIMYNLDYRLMIGSGNTITNVSLDNLNITDNANNIILLPLHF